MEEEKAQMKQGPRRAIKKKPKKKKTDKNCTDKDDKT